jgi:exopolyphosphatase / guanosine-5'-triphosphate,3'-diphosphate pyrophosphatase
MSQQSPERRVAVLDLGSASFHLVIADVKEPTSIAVITDKREDLALGRAVGETGRVDRSSADTAISVATSFAAKAERRHATDVIVVATSALRIASNGERLLERIEEETGHEVRALSGDAEAILAYVGANAGLCLEGGPTIVADLGGGSLEVACGTGSNVLSTTSLPLGSLRLAGELTDNDPPSSAEWRRLAHHASTTTKSELADVGSDRPHLVVTGGTAKALARLDARDHDVDLADGYRLDREALRELERRLLGSPRRDRIAMPGMSKRRVDSVGPGAVVLSALMETLGVPSLTVSPWGFREGIMLATLRTGGHSVLVRMEAEEPAA